jgi:hypothetical protein
MLKIISAAERLAARRGAKVLLLGRSGIGKTSQLRTLLNLSAARFIEAEGGDIAVLDLPVPTIRIQSFAEACDLVVRLVGPNPSYPPNSVFSEAHFKAAGGWLEGVDEIATVFLDSITSVGRFSFKHAENLPEAITDRGKKDMRAVYRLHAHQMLGLLHHLQTAREKNVVLVGILEYVKNEFGHTEAQLQIEGEKVPRELPGIIDEIITYEFIDYGDGEPPKRGFVCGPNKWGFPAKDRSGRLDLIEPPDLGKLLVKLTQRGDQK